MPDSSVHGDDVDWDKFNSGDCVVVCDMFSSGVFKGLVPTSSCITSMATIVSRVSGWSFYSSISLVVAGVGAARGSSVVM